MRHSAKLREAMLPDDADHAACVEAWLQAIEPDLLIPQFERALKSLWRRAEATLGEVTLSAIFERVLCVTSESQPCVTTLKLDRSGLRFDEFREQEAGDANLREVVRLVLTEFLTVVGHLTGEILTPALHAQLSKTTVDEPGGATTKRRY